MKRINYKIADTIYLLLLFAILGIFRKYAFSLIQSNQDTIKIAIGISVAFLSIYIQRFFFRPSFQEVVNLRERGWKITGYYSAFSLSNEEIYNKSYSLWVKYGIVSSLFELFVLLVVYVLNGYFLTNGMLVAHILCICILMVVVWWLTRSKENKVK